MKANFEDYIELYKNIDRQEWITIYQHRGERTADDPFTFSALITDDKKKLSEYLTTFEWGFRTDSFGKSIFGKTWSAGRETLYFEPGDRAGDFEYLVAIREFADGRKPEVEINPKLIWYYNLALTSDGFEDPKTNSLVISVTDEHIQVNRIFLKDFLAAYGKCGVIVFDHRRFFDSAEKKPDEQVYKGDTYSFGLSVFTGHRSDNKWCSCLLGKVLVRPFQKPRHPDYKLFTEDPKHATFIIGYDEENDEDIEYTSRGADLANFFGNNPHAPHFLTPVFFEVAVLDKYKKNPKRYDLSDGNVRYHGEWSLPYSINPAGLVHVWLGDLGSIPFSEQQYWRAFNVLPKGGLEEKFFKRQLLGEWTDASSPEQKLLSVIGHFNAFASKKYGDIIFTPLSKGDEEIPKVFSRPTNPSLTEYQSFLMHLSKLTVESINTHLIKDRIEAEKLKGLGSIGQLRVLFKETGVVGGEAVCDALKKGYDSRSKLAGHRASTAAYNKIWGRPVNEPFNSIEDSTVLLESLIGALESVLAWSSQA